MSLDLLALNDSAWTSFVRDTPASTAFHTPAWAGVIADTYRFRTFGAAVRDGTGRIVAGVPVAEVRTLRGARKWVALPFTDTCAVLGSVEPAKRELLNTLAARASAEGISVVEVRDHVDCRLIQNPVAVQHVLRLDADPEAVRSGFHGSQIRRPLRKVLEEGAISIRIGTEASDLTSVFYKLHAQTRVRLGVPVQPLRFFRLLWDRMLATGQGHVLIASAGGRDVAAAVFLTTGDTVIYKYGASDEDARRRRANLVLFWHAIRTASLGGWRSFDFGRSDFDNAGLRAFKSNWGAEERPLVYASTRAAATDSAPSAGERLMASAIKRAPVALARGVGYALYKYAA